MMTESPLVAARSSAPRARSVKKGFRASRTMRPTVRLWPARSWRAASLRTKPSSLIAERTRWEAAAETLAGRLSTLDTVPTDTPARAATSRMLAGALIAAP